MSWRTLELRASTVATVLVGGIAVDAIAIMASDRLKFPETEVDRPCSELKASDELALATVTVPMLIQHDQATCIVRGDHKRPCYEGHTHT
jgi:hypothetical protein